MTHEHIEFAVRQIPEDIIIEVLLNHNYEPPPDNMYADCIDLVMAGAILLSELRVTEAQVSVLDTTTLHQMFDPDPVENPCPVCGGPSYNLGGMNAYRCRNCGWTHQIFTE